MVHLPYPHFPISPSDMSKDPTYVVKVPVQHNGKTVWQDAGFAYRSGSGADERISVTIGDYRCVLVRRARDIEIKYNQLRREPDPHPVWRRR